MRQVLGSAGTITSGIVVAFSILISSSARAQEASASNGFSLPGVTLPQGTDEVRAADGTSCRSAVGGNGAYVDMGMIGKAKNATENSSYYGRVVIPIGRSPKRLDCSKLYELEVERLKLELELAKAGLGRSEDPELTDSTETASLTDETTQEPAAELASAEEAAPEEIVPEAPKSKKKKAKKPVQTVKAVTKKVGKAAWADEGWTDDGMQDGN